MTYILGNDDKLGIPNKGYNSTKAKEFVHIILDWSKSNLRDYPWRKTKDPYRILIAEIMLQRTKADQVLSAYQRFIQKFPSFSSIIKADVSDINDQIASLGLKKRASVLKRLAEEITIWHENKVPKSEKELLKLYGVGKYIANALLCHAFEEDVPTVDANFARVMERVFSLDLKKPAQKDSKVHDYATKVVVFAEGQCRDLNLGILDLSNKVCTARKPSCNVCPLLRICDFGRQKIQNIKEKK